MKSPEDALHTWVEEISNAIEEGEFGLAANASNNLTRLAHSLESPKDVFVGEVMGMACGHIDYVLRSYQVSRDSGDAMHDDIVSHTADLVVAHKEQQNVCHILQQIRYVTTSFVLDAEQHFPHANSSGEQGGEIVGLSASMNPFGAPEDGGHGVADPPHRTWRQTQFANKATPLPMLSSPPMQYSFQPANVQELRDDVAGLREKTDWLVGAVHEIKKMMETQSPDESGPDNYDMAAEQVRKLILDNYELGESFYPSDIADKHGLDYDTVLEAIEMLRRECRIKDEA